MSAKQFFIKRYKKLGWKYKKIRLKRAIRINTMNTNEDYIVTRLENLGITLEKIEFLKKGYWICKSKFSVGATAEYLLGLYSIQEAASQIPVTVFSELMDKTVLDTCSSPGIKTTQLANDMKNSGVIVALEIKKQKMFALINQIERCHVKNTIVYNMDAKDASKLKLKFDCILLDVPCSGNPITDQEWFKKRTIKDVHRNARRQKQILSESTKVLKEGGEIVYATCSLEPEENEFNADWAINNLPLKIEKIQCYGKDGLTNIFGKQLDESIKNCKRIWPTQTQGFFICKFKKQEEK